MTARELKQFGAVILVGLIFFGASVAYTRYHDRIVPNPTPPAPVPVKTVIQGKTERNVGQLAVYTVGKTTKQRQWLVFPKADIETNEDASKMYLSTEKAGNYTIVLSYLGDDDKLSSESMSVTVGTPEPVPPPAPPTPPKPVTPLTGFAEKVFNFVSTKNVVPGVRDYPAADCLRAANSFESVASMIAAGGIPNIETAKIELEKLNKALNLDPKVWAPFGKWAAVELEDKTLKGVEATFREIAEGLHASGGAK